MASGRRRSGWDAIRRGLGRAYLRLLGWRIAGEVPAAPRFVAIAAPHTSYWDFPHMIAFAFATGQHVSFLMKASLFVGPLGWIFRALGGIPVDRSGSFGLVAAVVREFAVRDELIVVVAPEGSRSRRAHWKSGFYRIALEAGVPIALGYMDWEDKVVGYGPLLSPTGDRGKDEAVLADFYADKRGRHPDQESTVCLSPAATADS